MKLKLSMAGRADLQALRARIPAVMVQLPGWQKVMVPRLANEILIDEMHRVMRFVDFDEKIVNGTYIDDIMYAGTKARIHITSEYVSASGFDVALAREEGTVDHKVEPRVQHPEEGVRTGRQTDVLDPDAKDYKKTKKGPLTFATGATPVNPKSKQAPRALSWLEDGERKFSKGHWVSGIPAYRIIATVIRERGPVLRRRYNEELVQWLQKGLGGVPSGS